MPNIIDLNTINENFLFYKLCFSLSVYNSKNIIVDMILLSIKEWEKLFYFFLSWSKGLVPYVYFNLYADQTLKYSKWSLDNNLFKQLKYIS